jgi:hypothetical protein
MSSTATFVPYQSSQIGGAIVVNIFGLISTSSLVAVLLRVMYLVFTTNFTRRSSSRSEHQSQPRECVFFNTQLGYYAACLLIANLLSDVSGSMNLIWLLQKGVTDDGFCRFQAVTMQVANVAAAYFTVTLSLHTLITLVLRKRQSVIVGSITIAVGWLLSIIIAVFPLRQKSFYGVSGLSCSIRPIFPKSLFFLHLFPIFLAASASAILYAAMFLILRGTLVVRGIAKVGLNFERNDARSSFSGMEEYRGFVVGIARSLIWFPIAYVVLLVPYSVTQLFSISGFRVPFEAVIFALVCWFLIGIVNVALLYNVFRVLGPVIDVRSNASTSGYNESKRESFGSLDPEKMPCPFPMPIHASSSTFIQQKERSSWSTDHSYPQSYAATQISGSSEYLVSSPKVHARQASEASLNQSRIARAISPVQQLNRGISTLPRSPAMKPAYVSLHGASAHMRQDSNASVDSIGLSAAPRQTRSEVTRGPYMSPSYTAPTTVPTDYNPRYHRHGAPSPISSSRSLSPTLSQSPSPPPVARLRNYPAPGLGLSNSMPMPRDSFGMGAPVTPRSATAGVADMYASGFPRSSYFETYYGTSRPQAR